MFLHRVVASQHTYRHIWHIWRETLPHLSLQLNILQYKHKTIQQFFICIWRKGISEILKLLCSLQSSSLRVGRRQKKKCARIIRQRLSWSNEENKGKRREDGGSFTCFPHTVFILILRVIARPIPAETLTWKKRRAACMRGWRSVNPLPAAGGSPFLHWFFTLSRYPLIPPILLCRDCQLFRVISTARPPISIDFDHRSAFDQLIMPFNTSTLSLNAFLSQMHRIDGTWNHRFKNVSI